MEQYILRYIIQEDGNQWTYAFGDATIYGNADFKFINKYGNVDRFYVLLLNYTKIYGDVNFNNTTDKNFSIYTSFEIGAGELHAGTATLNINRLNGVGFAINSSLRKLTTSEDSTIVVNMNDAVDFRGISSVSDTNMLGKLQIHFYGNSTFSKYTSNTYQYLSTNGTADIYFHGQDVVVDTINNFRVHANTTEEGTTSYILLKKDGTFKDVEIDANSELYIMGSATIDGDLELKQNARITVDGVSLSITGNFTGEQGILTYNGTETAQITGEVIGTIYVETTKQEIEIYANTASEESAIASSDTSRIEIVSNLTDENRIWTVKALKIAQVIYVKDDGDDSNSGIDEDNSVATMRKAFSIVPEEGTIVICGPLTIASWPDNDGKNVTISSKITKTSSEGNEETIDFRDTNNAVVTFKNSARIGSGQNLGIHLDADITFTYLSIAPESNNYTIFAGANNIVFGEKGDEDSIRNANNNCFIIYGATSVGGDSNVDFTINAGKFGNIIVGARSGKVTDSTFTMNGGSINTLYLSHYSGVNGTTNVNINGGTVRGDIQPSNTSGGQSGTVNLNIKNEVKFGTSSKIYVGGQWREDAYYTLNVEGKTDQNSIIIPTIYMGSNALTNMNLTVGNFKNATINTLYVGGNGTNTQTYPVEILLDSKTLVKTLYGGPASTGSIPSTVDITLKDDAQIEGFNREVNGRKAEVLNIIYEDTGSEQEHKIVTEAYEGADSLIIGQNAYVELSQEDETFKFNSLSVVSNGHAYLSKVFTLPGNYIGNETQDGAGCIYLKDGTQFIINGTVEGYTILRCMDAENYVSDSGMLITSAVVTDTDAENYFALENGKIIYTTSDTNSSWQVRGASDAIDRNKVYVSSISGSDGTSGTEKLPVKTIHGAYEKIASLYELNYSLLDSEQKEFIDTNGYKIILLDGVQVTTGDTTIAEHPAYKVTITSDKNQDGILEEEETGNILFSDTNQNLIYFAGTTILEYLNINSILSNNIRPVFAASGFDVTFGKEIKVTASDDTYPEVYGGKYTTCEVESTNLKVQSGKYTSIYGGGYSANVTGNVNLILGLEEEHSGPDTVNIGLYNQTYTGVFGGGFSSQVQGNVNVTVYGGKYYRITGGGKQVSATVNGDINLDFEAGETGRIYGGGESGLVNGNATVIVGSGNANTEAKVTGYLRGSGMYEGLASGKVATVTIKDGAVLPESTQVAAGGYQGNVSKSVLNVEGGNIECNVFGGGWGVQGDETKGVSDETEVNITGGTIKSSIFGGGNLGKVEKITRVNVSQGTIEGNIYGGGNEANVQDTEVNISLENTNIEVYGGCYAGKVDGKSLVNITGGNLENVFGGGYGETAITQESEVKITDGIVKNIYGGGNLGKTINTNIVIAGGEVESAYAGGKLAEVEKTNTQLQSGKVTNIYGGGYGETAIVSNSNIETVGGEAENIYGGGDLGNVLETNLKINDGNLQNIYGGGNKAQVDTTNVNIYGGNIIGNIFGGGNEADVIHTNVYLYGGNLGNAETKAYIYGGGNKASATVTTIHVGDTEDTTEYVLNTNCDIFGGNNSSGIEIADSVEEVMINVNKDITADIYGGCNSTGFILNKVTIEINAKVTGNIYGAGFGNSTYVGKDEATIESLLIKINSLGEVTNSVYGGGNSGQVYGDTKLEIHGTVNQIYGAGYGQESIVYGNTYVEVGSVEKQEQANINDIYGGGFSGRLTGSSNITQLSGNITNLFGGGFEAEVPETNIHIVNGTSVNVYGGGYVGSINTSTINVNGGQVLTSIYGGGYNGEVQNSTNVNILSGQVGTRDADAEVYGGGFGEVATVKGNTNVIINGSENTTSDLYIYGNVYGGGNAGNVYGNSHVNIFDATITKSVYGGGNAADIGESEGAVDENHGNAFVEFTQGVVGEVINEGATNTYTGELFGGGNLGKVYGDTEVLVGDKDSEYYVTMNGEMYAGGKGETGFTTVYGDSNATIAGINTVVVKYGSIERGEVVGDVNITFNNYKNRNAINRYKDMSGINKATNMNLINSYVYLTEGLTQIYNLYMPYGSGLMISKDSTILGDFSGGGTLYLQNEVLLTITQDVVGNEKTTLILNPELVDDQTYVIKGSIESPYIKVLGEDTSSANAFISGYASKYSMQNTVNSDNHSIYYIDETIVIPGYLDQRVGIDSGKIYTTSVHNTDDVYILNHDSFTADINLEFTIAQNITVDEEGNRVEADWNGTYENVYKKVMLKSESDIQVIPKGTKIILTVNGVQYLYKVENDNETGIEIRNFKLLEENVSYEEQTVYFEEVTNIYENREITEENEDALTNVYKYIEDFKMIFDFSNCEKEVVEKGIYNVVIVAYDNLNKDENLYEDNEEIYTMFNTNAVQIEKRDYNLSIKDGEDSYFTKDGYDRTSKIEINAVLNMNKVSIYNESDLGRKLNAILTIQNELGEVVDLPNGAAIYVNDKLYQSNTNSCLVTLVEELQSESTKYDLKIEIDFSATKLNKDFMDKGTYTINLDYYLANEENQLVSSKIHNSKFEGLKLGELTGYGIDVEVQNTNKVSEDKLLLINQDGDITKNISLDYVLQDMYEDASDNGGKIVITSQKKKTPAKFIYEDIGSLTIDDTIEVESTDSKVKTQDIDLIFSDDLENGTYRIVFTLYDKFDNKLTDTIMNFIVARN